MTMGSSTDVAPTSLSGLPRLKGPISYGLVALTLTYAVLINVLDKSVRYTTVCG
jgi:hypothetical protein